MFTREANVRAVSPPYSVRRESQMISRPIRLLSVLIAVSESALLAGEPPALAAPGSVVSRTRVQGQPDSTLKPIVCRIRMLEGKPDGKIEDGSVKVLAEPTVTTLEKREARFEVSGKLHAPGTGEELLFGTFLTVTPGKIDQGHLVATITLETSDPVKTEGEPFVVSRGNVLRATGLFSLGSTTKIIAKNLDDGGKLWVEITFEEATQVRTSTNANLPRGSFQEIPSAQTRERKGRR
jgi:hypothetical protein